MAVHTTHTSNSFPANMPVVPAFAAEGDSRRAGEEPRRCAESASVRAVSGGTEEVYAHALCLEREAISCYLALAECLETRGDDEVAMLFRQLARRKGESVFALMSEVAVRPELTTSEASWLISGPAERDTYAFVFHLMTPWNALDIAAAGINRAKLFFERVPAMTADPRARSMAAEMVREESDHLACLRQARARAPRPVTSEEEMEQLLNWGAAAAELQ